MWCHFTQLVIQTSIKHKICVTHLHRSLQMPSSHRKDVVYSLSPGTATDSAQLLCIGRNTVSHRCVWEEDQTGWLALARHHTAAWSRPWRLCFYSSSDHTLYPSSHYGGSPLYQSSGPDPQSVWWLSSLHRDNIKSEKLVLLSNIMNLCGRLILNTLFPHEPQSIF